jgi:DNA-binding NarL/FixJ family response regulator
VLRAPAQYNRLGSRIVGADAGSRLARCLAIQAADQVAHQAQARRRDAGSLGTKRIVGCDTPATRVFVLTTFDVDEYVYDAMRVGVNGLLLKDLPAEELVAAIRQVARGSDALLAPSNTRRLWNALRLGGHPL